MEEIKSSKRGNRKSLLIILGILGIILVVGGIVFFALTKKDGNSKTPGEKSQNKLEEIQKNYANVESYKYNAKGKSDKGNITIEANIYDISKYATIESKVVVANETIEKKFKFDVVDNRYEQSIKLDGNWYTSQVSDSIDSPVNVEQIDATKMLATVRDNIVKVDNNNQYILSNEEKENFIMSTQLITDGAFESSLLSGDKVTFKYNFDKKKNLIEDINICFGDCNKQNLNITFSDVKK